MRVVCYHHVSMEVFILCPAFMKCFLSIACGFGRVVTSVQGFSLEVFSAVANVCLEQLGLRLNWLPAECRDFVIRLKVICTLVIFIPEHVKGKN